ncbi:BQ5605_C003g02165 [Microbotryum silenes-dioicae]|uniref:chitin synthase n=1 Tax=Microbotryum silenes-dioicae TaxID=796604 RepID=A0A2X0M0Z9_9BASI|nr:BQ5605_C003g02165 [Microbotryum silenes-dioicae]
MAPSSTGSGDATRNLVSLLNGSNNSSGAAGATQSSVGAMSILSSDTVSSKLTQRYKSELTSSFVGDTNLVVINPLRVLGDVSEASKAEYEARCYLVREGKGGGDVQPHVYELACRTYLMMRRTGITQSVVFRYVVHSGLTGSGATSQAKLFTSQILRLASSGNKKETRIVDQVEAVSCLLNSFGSAKTSLNPSSSRHATFFEMHFNHLGRISGAKLVTWGLDKGRVRRLDRDERTFNVFYQLLAGATPEERQELALLTNPMDYKLLASSGTSRLPPTTPNSDDSIACEDLRLAFKALGFKPRHISAIFRLVAAILTLSNLEFADPVEGQSRGSSESAWVTNRIVLDHAAELLGITSEDLERALTNRVRWVRKEMVAVILRAEGAGEQRDSLMSALYSILFAFIVETVNHKLFPGDEAIVTLQAQGGSSIVQLDQPGHASKSQSRPGSGILIRAMNGYEEFINNYAAELTRFWLCEYEFDGDAGIAARAQEDGVRVADVVPPDASARIELLRGGRVGGKADKKPGGLLGGLAKVCGSIRKGALAEEADQELLKGLKSHFGAHTAFVASPSGPSAKSAFGIVHFGGIVTYSATGFAERDLDLLDPEFVSILRTSSDGFIGKLFSGPNLAAEFHPLDENIIVAAQVSSAPMRQPSPIRPSPAFAPETSDLLAPLLDPVEIRPISSQINATLSQLLALIERTHVWSVTCLRPNDSCLPNRFDPQQLRSQVTQLLLPELIARKQIDFVQDIDYDAFADRHRVASAKEAIRVYLNNFELFEGVDYALGHARVWLSYKAFRAVEDHLRTREPLDHRAAIAAGQPVVTSLERRRGSKLPVLNRSTSHIPPGVEDDEWEPAPPNQPFASTYDNAARDSVEDLVQQQQQRLNAGANPNSTPGSPDPMPGTLPRRHAFGYDDSMSPMPYVHPTSMQSDVWGEKEGLSRAVFGGHSKGFGVGAGQGQPHKEGALDQNGDEQQGATVEEVPSSKARRAWVFIVTLLTWWIPDLSLKYLGRMKRPDVRMAWREKVALCLLIGFFCGIVIFYIVIFGNLLCPNMNKAWNEKELGYHAGTTDYWVGVRGVVYDLTAFYRTQHSDISSSPVTSSDMLELGGQDLTNYFPIPLTLACPSLVSSTSLVLQYANFTADLPTAIHYTGTQQSVSSSALYSVDWYSETFIPKMNKYKKGPLVWSKKQINQQVNSETRYVAIVNSSVYDLTDYFYTITTLNDDTYKFLNTDLTALWQAQAGSDITSAIKELNLDATTLAINMDCMRSLFYTGETDFRLTPRCQVQPNMLLAFSVLLMATIVAKFIAALQFGSKRMPELRDKFVICQVPCYTEGEESLRKTIDSLATLIYDDKRKLLMIICDGMIIGSGNDRATPRIVLDILGVDQDVDPEPLMFKSIAEGSKQLNYGKVWSGLYEIDGHVVPYVVIAKVGRPAERSRPGNRGKRDSQILSMRFLNRVHFDSEMYPLELEMYHQIKNVIGVDPQLYEYLLVIDADTNVAADSLNRLVSAAADDSKIIGICGETKLENEQDSWWTMIQVYEYYISHHLAKAFESMFGSVTCLPGCFTMYRLRSADKGKPLLVSSLIIDEYSEGTLDTLHKKNLLALGEDRYLTTLILKHFPMFKTKFLGEAQAMTVAPHSWTILLSQRRRWINSTVHNLVELIYLPNMCGFCCFGMRFFVMIDLIGTLILPATFVYLVYLIVEVSLGDTQVPVIALAMVGATYGLQAVIFLFKRQWQFIGWLVIYILAYPIYSFILPIYSFWRFDDFTWGNTRVVVGEGKSKKVVQAEEEAFDESSIPMARFSEYEARMEEEQHYDEDTKSHYTHSIAGFSMATKLGPPATRAGSYAGGTDYYRDTVHSRRGSKAAFSQFGGGQPGEMGSVLGVMPSRPSSQFFGAAGSTLGMGAPSGPFMGSPSQMPFYQGPHMSVPSFGSTFPGLPAMPSQMTMNPPHAMVYDSKPQQPLSSLPRRQSDMSALTFSTFPASTGVYGVTRPLTGPQVSQSTSPSDEELVSTLKAYLASQDLMKVTKRTAREGLQAFYPQTQLGPRKDAINVMIDGVLAGKM